MDDLLEMVKENTEMFEHHKTYSWGGGSKKVEDILRATLTLQNLTKMLKENTEWFDFTELCSEQKCILLSEDFDTFSKHIEVVEIPTIYKVDIFINSPAKMIDYIDFNKVTKDDMSKIARQRPSYFKKYKLPLNKLGVTGWRKLTKKKEYVNKFFEHIDTIRNKSELRRLLVHRKEIIPQLTVEAVEKSILTAKEWILFMNWPDFKDESVMYNDDVLSWIDMEFSCEVLSGNQSTSRHTDKARKLLEEFKDGQS